MRALTEIEQKRLQILTENAISLTLIEPTTTGLKKSIMDATGSVRSYLLREEVHDYGNQKQGPDNKIMIESLIYEDDKEHSSKASLYRPNTKKGDPRIWFKKLSQFTNANDILAIINFQEKLHVINLTKSDLAQIIKSDKNSPIKELVLAINQEENIIANELLNLLRRLAKKGPIPSLLNADTSVGRTLETALGIDINSSKKPDYKGIEIKSFRSKRNNRKSLFAQVPDWKISKFKSSAEILDNFGYWREDDYKLYCTVSTLKPNSQGLKLYLNTDLERLIENSIEPSIGDFAVWTLDKLHKRLQEKHKETFWVAADTISEDGKDYFVYTEVEHTRKPIISQFDILLSQGKITLDHLIKRNSKGVVKEKGPLFKINPKSLSLLFPPSKHYFLNS